MLPTILTVEVLFEGSILITGLYYLASWMGGRKLTNRQALEFFGICLGGLFALKLIVFTMPSIGFPIVCAVALLRKPAHELLAARSAKRANLLPVQNPPVELPGN